MNRLLVCVTTSVYIAHAKCAGFDFYHFRLKMNARERGTQFKQRVVDRLILLPGPRDQKEDRGQNDACPVTKPDGPATRVEIFFCLGVGTPAAENLSAPARKPAR